MRAAELAARPTERLRTAPAWALLTALAAVQLAITAWFAFETPHNGFVWYSGGDATEYWTSSYSLAHGTIPQTFIGYGIPVLYAWVPLVTGTTLLAGIPVIVALQAIVLVPLAVFLFFGVADLLFGRRFAWWASVLWVFAPLLFMAGLRADYRANFEQWFLAPHWYGLTNMADFPSLVAVLATAWASLRLLERPNAENAVLAGLFAGVLIAMKPSNGFFVPALLVLLAGVRRWQPLAIWAASFAPALLTLAIWKARGLGHLPITSSATAGVREASAAAPLIGYPGQTYVQFDWSHLSQELTDLREFFWSVRFLEFLVVAGALGALRRSRLRGLFVVVWFGAYCLVKGSSTLASISTTSYFRLVEPGLPALVLLVASLAFLVPRAGRAFAQTTDVARLPGGRRTLGAAAVLLAVVPLVLVVALSPATTPLYARSLANGYDGPLSDVLAATRTSGPQGVTLTWRRPATHGTRAFFVVYRSSQNNGCILFPEGAKACQLEMDQVGMTRGTSWTDRHPGPGRHWYRIALMANYRDELDGSDLMLLGPATSAP